MKFKCYSEVNGFTYEIKKGYVYELYEQTRIAKYKMQGYLGWQIPEALSKSTNNGALVLLINNLIKNHGQLNPGTKKPLSKKFLASLAEYPTIEDRATEDRRGVPCYYEKVRPQFS